MKAHGQVRQGLHVERDRVASGYLPRRNAQRSLTRKLERVVGSWHDGRAAGSFGYVNVVHREGLIAEHVRQADAHARPANARAYDLTQRLVLKGGAVALRCGGPSAHPMVGDGSRLAVRTDALAGAGIGL